MTCKQLYMALIVLLLSSCGGSGRYDGALRRAQSVLNARPDSALLILDSLAPVAPSMSRPTLMRWQLLRTQAQNKCDTVFRSDSLQLALVDYYDRHGTPNERMTAHYLLGRAYSDMGEAPLALESFQKAIEHADTTAADCDFHVLCSVFGQIGMTFNAQQMSDEELMAYEQFSHFSLKDGDTLNYIKGQELKVVPYYALDDTASCFCITDRCHHLYLSHGFSQEAARVYYTAILLRLQQGQCRKAHEMMKVFEGQSGLFDSSGNIEQGREQYYYCKGLYFMGINVLDSAEYFFRKLLPFHLNMNYEAYKGLMMVYQNRGRTDSIVKYSTLSENALDSIFENTKSQSLAITNSLYRYDRLKNLALIKERENARLRDLILVIVAVVLALVYLGCSKYMGYKRRKEAELLKLDTEYAKAVGRCNELNREIQLIQSDKEAAILERQEEIGSLQTDIVKYKSTMEGLSYKEKEILMMKDETVLAFKEMSQGKREVPLPSDEDWLHLEKLFMKNYPQFYQKIIQNDLLGIQEKRTCMLSCLYFKPGDIAVLLGTSPQRITNVKSKANFKIFCQRSASSLIKNLKDIG